MESSQKNGLRILCVDDDPSIRDVLKIYLKREGHVVHTAADGALALRMVEPDLNAYDLIITDNEMPNLTGLAMIEKLRQIGCTAKLMLFSGTVAPDATEIRERFGIEAIIPKGTPTALMQHVRRVAIA